MLNVLMRWPFPWTSGRLQAVWLPQPTLLGDEEDMHEIAAAITKLQKSAKHR
jgi:hypothetical protein